MSLLTDSMEIYTVLNKTTKNDGYGGIEITWSDGAEISAAIDVPDSSLSSIADKITERRNCRVITSRAVTLQLNDVIKRKSDGMYIRILEDSRDNKTPRMAALDMRVYKAEIMQALPDIVLTNE